MSLAQNIVLATKPAVAYPRDPRYSASVGRASSSGLSHPTESSCIHRPVNMVAWEGSVHDEAARAESNRIPRLGELDQGIAGGAVVSVKAQMIGGDRVEHDQKNVRRARRRQRPRDLTRSLQ